MDKCKENVQHTSLKQKRTIHYRAIDLTINTGTIPPKRACSGLRTSPPRRPLPLPPQPPPPPPPALGNAAPLRGPPRGRSPPRL